VAKKETEIVARGAPPQALAVGGMTADQVDLVRRTICKDATDDELQLFLMQCKRTGLDPFSKQIHAVKRWDAKDRRNVMSIQVGIDGFRLVAQRTGDLDGQEGPFWCGPDGVWRDVWLDKGHPCAAKVIVHRKGCSRPFAGIVHWEEFKQEYKDRDSGQMRLTPFWLRMPAGQLAKCAEATALRKAFPQELSGLYAPEEMREEPQEEAAQEQPKDQPRALPAPAAKPDEGKILCARLTARIAEAKTVEEMKAINRDAKAGAAVLSEAHKAAISKLWIDRRQAIAPLNDPVEAEERKAIEEHGG